MIDRILNHAQIPGGIHANTSRRNLPSLNRDFDMARHPYPTTTTDTIRKKLPRIPIGNKCKEAVTGLGEVE